MQRTGKQFKNIRGRLYKCVGRREATLKVSLRLVFGIVVLKK